VSERLGMSRKQFLAEHNSVDIMELMAYDRLKDDEYHNELKSEMQTEEDRMKQIRALFGG
jgi:hypothetical protein